jgi:hypothetical protein
MQVNCPIQPLVRTALICAFAALVACATQKPAIRATLEPSAQLSSYRTYGFVAEPGTNRSGYTTPMTNYLKAAIRTEMDARGYHYVELAADPDLVVNFNANAREKADVQSRPTAGYGGYYGGGYYGYRGGMYAVGPVYSATEVETVRYKVGTVNVDLADARKKQLIWEAIAEARLTEEMMKDPQPAVNSVVAEMFTKFPGRAAGAP